MSDFPVVFFAGNISQNVTITAYAEVDRAGSLSTKLESRFFRASIIIVLRENYTEAIKNELNSFFQRRDFFVTRNF